MRQFSPSYKDIPIGIIITRDLERRGLSIESLSSLLNMPLDAVADLINGNIALTDSTAGLIESFLDYEKGFLLRLQEINGKSRKEKLNSDKTAPFIRKCVFWDIDISRLDWIKNSRFIIDRVLSYGNEAERKAIKTFYSLQ